jgi:hypothetical protein
MAFMGPCTARLLLVTDAGHEAVHVIDVVGRGHVGYVAAPGTIVSPTGVAARGFLVAVCALDWTPEWGHVVRLFEGSGASWAVVRNVGLGPYFPRGLRFTSDGKRLAVAHSNNPLGYVFTVSVFRVEDGSFERGLGGYPNGAYDVEEVDDGWLFASWITRTIQFVDCSGAGRAICDGQLKATPMNLALIGGFGLVVRESHVNHGRLQFFATPDVIAMASMSAPRVAWITAARRGRIFRELQLQLCKQHAFHAAACKRRPKKTTKTT